MQRHRQQRNPINAAALARWIVITSFIGLGGLMYVYQSLQLHSLGDQKKKLEVELVNVKSQIDVAGVQIAALTSRDALERRLKEGYLKMEPIEEQYIVRLVNPPVRLKEPIHSSGSEIAMPVSNPPRVRR